MGGAKPNATKRKGNTNVGRGTKDPETKNRAYFCKETLKKTDLDTNCAAGGKKQKIWGGEGGKKLYLWKWEGAGEVAKRETTKKKLGSVGERREAHQ